MERKAPSASPFVYAPADVLTLPSLAGVPLTLAHGQAPPVGLGDLAEAMLSMGALWPQQWNGELLSTMNECFLLWTEEKTGQGDGLEALHWWDLLLVQDVEALEYLYDAEEAKERLRSNLKLEGRPMAAFALQAATDRSVKLGDCLTRLSGHLRSLGVRPEPALSHLMGVLTCTVNQLGGWTPQIMRDRSRERDEWGPDFDEDYEPQDPEYSGNNKKEWEELPEWLFSSSWSTAALRRIEKKLRSTAGEHSLAYWVMARAAELAVASDAFKACKDFGDHIHYCSYEFAPSLVLQWLHMGEMDAHAHYVDYEFDTLWQSEHHNIEWLYVFDPTDKESSQKAGRACAALLALTGALDRFLVALDRFAQSGPTVRMTEGRIRV